MKNKEKNLSEIAEKLSASEPSEVGDLLGDLIGFFTGRGQD